MINLSDIEKDLLREFWGNASMRDTVYRMLNQNFEVAPMQNVSDDQIGQEVRAMWKARQIVQLAFNEISTLETPKDKGRKENQAR
jgi:hypothetical protein